MRDVDHIIPFESIDDPRRLDWNNLQSLCARCHDRKSARDHARR
jgi:5-methylcytosine-specific restriction endonuclease McrA